MPKAAAADTDPLVASVRAFNRFYTRQLGVLDESVLASGLSLTEMRVLYELAHRDGATATELGRDLGLDAGYLSRLLSKFEARRWLKRSPAPGDARQSLLVLTPSGRKAFAPIEKAAREQIATWLEALPPPQRDRLVKSMETVQRLLGGLPEAKVAYVLRDLRPGDLGWIVHRQSLLYHQEYGWDETFDALVAEIAGGFVKRFDAKRERCWVAEREGEVVGSAFLVRASDRVAKLRLLYVESSARGLEPFSVRRNRGFPNQSGSDSSCMLVEGGQHAWRSLTPMTCASASPRRSRRARAAARSQNVSISRLPRS